MSVDMSAASSLLSEDQFLCSICLDVFTDPVTIPCGHNFCKTCITEHWNINVQCQCPNCKEVFNTRPELHVNTLISEMAAQFRQSALINPVEYLVDRMCMKHDKLLELFCKADQMRVCSLCTVSDHKKHDVVPLKEEYEGKKAEMGKTENEIEQMVQKRQLKIQEMKHSVELSKKGADREIVHGVQVFVTLKESVEKSLAELIDTIKEKQRKTEKQAEDFIKELEQEISELKKRSTDLEQLSHSEDHLHLLQSFPFLKADPPTKDWTEVSIQPSSYEGTVRRAVNQLEETFSQQTRKLFEAELKRVQQFAVDVTLDPDTVKDHYEGKKAEMGKTENEIEQMVQKRRLKIQEIKHSVELSKEDADREMADGVQVFTALKESVERSQAEFIDTIKEKQRKTEKQAEDFIKELEQEISELKKRSTELEQLSHSEDHLHLLQSFPSLNAAPPTKDWTEVSVRPPSYIGTVRRAVNQLEETLSQQMKKLLEAELKRVQQFAVDVTLDPDTANPYLILSDVGKQVKHGDAKRNLPDNPERFHGCPCVLAKHSFSSGRFYYEVQVKGKTEWDLGVARETINRRGQIIATPKNGYWTIWLRNDNEYKALAGPSVHLSLKSRPEKVGVFVDYEEGLVSFYDVDAAALIYSFTGCCFLKKLFPLFSPSLNYGGKNSAPLIISPVNHTGRTTTM